MRFEPTMEQLSGESFIDLRGSVKRVDRESVRIKIPNAKVGSLCVAKSAGGNIPLEIVSLSNEGHVAMPLGDLLGIRLGDPVQLEQSNPEVAVGEGLLGRVIDSMGRDYESGTDIDLPHRASLYGTPGNPMERQLIRNPLDLGVRSLNACLTCGMGQRMGIFAGSGVGKSVLLGMIARHTAADVVVIALIGERGREVREFIENELGEEGRRKSVVVVETSDKSAVRRTRGAYLAASVAEHFRSKGLNVLMLMDSLTRFAMAQREIGIAAGEPPTTKGYTPSVYASLSRLVERAGNWGDAGSITGLYTVLVEGDDMDDPVADSARAILDGHVVLSRKLANRGHYPAVDVLSSVSRVMDQITDKNQQFSARTLKRIISKYEDNEDAITIGIYQKGTDAMLDECIGLYPVVNKFLQQDRDEVSNMDDSVSRLEDILANPE